MLINKLSGFANALYDATLALVFPQACAVCGASVAARGDAPACGVCWSRTRVFTGDETLCWKCGEEAHADVAPGQRVNVRCRRCDADEYTAARAVGPYAGALGASILALKREPHVHARLARLLCKTQRGEPLSAATRVLPVPLHPRRQKERGFNQAAVLARAVAEQTGLPLDEYSLVRRAHTERHRAGMDRRARRESVEGAFAVARPRLVDGERVLLVDDVLTTGATVSSCAHVLRAAGATEVYVLTVARA